MGNPDGSPGQSTAAESAARASASAAQAHESADIAMEAAVQAAVAAAVTPLKTELEAAKLEIERLNRDETTDDQQATATVNLLASLQSQFLWVTSGAVLVGAAIGYFLTKVFA